ncbi:MAG: helix-turn-helix domain-containing protein [Actinomycetia bacterium]|nr:helix-turn-helix domain-containing protein [Actinomycetes bacterium]
MPVEFRNVDASPTDDVRTWPYEALVTVIDRGLVGDWQPIFAEIRRSPWGRVARRVEHYLTYREYDGVSTLFGLAIERARVDADQADRAEVAARIRDAVAGSGLTNAEFARLVGTSASRLSTYLSGKVAPSSSMLLRIERTARDLQRSSEGETSAVRRGRD